MFMLMMQKTLGGQKGRVNIMKIEEATDNTTEANQSTDENLEKMEETENIDDLSSSSPNEESEKLDIDVEKGVKELKRSKKEEEPFIKP